MELGTLADWLNALGTYLAFTGAAFAGVVAWKSYRTQQAATDRQLAHHADEETQRLQTERQTQARSVAMWIFRGRIGWRVQWVNASHLPIYRVVVHLHSENPRFSVAIERGTQGPSLPGTSRKMSSVVRHLLEQHDGLDMEPDDLKLAIAFTDTSGVRWVRDEQGALREAKPDFNFGDAERRILDRDVPMDEFDLK